MPTDKWTVMRQKGMWHYVFFRGVLGWGVPTGLMVTVFIWALLDVFDILKLWIWPVMGVFFGLSTWWFGERKYQAVQDADKNKEQ